MRIFKTENPDVLIIESKVFGETAAQTTPGIPSAARDLSVKIRTTMKVLDRGSNLTWHPERSEGSLPAVIR